MIWAPPWNETSGGTVALHALCHRLNGLGVPAALWPDSRPLLRRGGILRWLRYAPSWLVRGRSRFGRGPFANPIAKPRDVRRAIIVYPEIVAGNPLGARSVVRWLLHRPGYHGRQIDHSADDLFFFYQPAFNDPAISGAGDDRWLRVMYIHPAYRRTNFGSREGAAFIVRKGADRVLDRHPADAIRIDDLSHEEKAAVFNQVETFHSYDPYTMYSLFASLCGALSIYLPEDGVPVERWSPGGRPPGIAYGPDDLAFAEATRDVQVEKIARDLEDEDEMIRRFVQISEDYFSAAIEHRDPAARA